MSMSSHPDELLKPVYRHPLGVPAGSVRAALTLMIVILFWLLLLTGGFLLGWVTRLGPWRRAYWFQDIQAWVSMLAMLALGAEIVIQIFINPTLEQSLN